MNFLVNLSTPRKSIIISETSHGDQRDLGTISLDKDFQAESFNVNGNMFKILPSSHRSLVGLVDSNGKRHKLSRSHPVMVRTKTGVYHFMLRDELITESAPRIPRYVKHSTVVHILLFAIGFTLSLFQPKVPEKIVFEVETEIIEKVQPPEPEPPKKVEPEKPKVVEKVQPKQKLMPAKRAPTKKTKVAKAPKAMPKPQKVAKVSPKAAPPAASTPNPAAQAAAAKRASVAKALNFMSASTGGVDAGPTFTKNKKGNMYGFGSEQTLNAKNPSVLSKIGAKSQGGNITTKGSRMISTASGIAGGLNKNLNDVQGRVSAANLYNGGSLEGATGASGLDLSGDGSIAQSLIEKILAKHIDKLRYCYEKALLSDASLGGNVLMQWTISSSGSARNVRTLRSAINSSKMHSCINQEISKIPFPKPSGGEVIVKFPFTFTSSSI